MVIVDWFVLTNQSTIMNEFYWTDNCGLSSWYRDDCSSIELWNESVRYRWCVDWVRDIEMLVCIGVVVSRRLVDRDRDISMVIVDWFVILRRLLDRIVECVCEISMICWMEEPSIHSKETSINSKEPCTHSKEPSTHSKDPGTYSKEPRIHSEEP